MCGTWQNETPAGHDCLVPADPELPAMVTQSFELGQICEACGACFVLVDAEVRA